MLFFEFAFIFDQFVNDVVEVAIHDGRDIGTRIMDAVVGDSVLREVVGAYFFGAVTGTDERFAGG